MTARRTNRFLFVVLSSLLVVRAAIAEVDVTPAVIDVGVVQPKSTTKQTLTVKNLSKNTAKILGADASCTMCTHIEVTPATIPPGESMQINITFAPPSSESGLVRRSITLHISDPEKRDLTIPLVGYVTDTAGIWPAQWSIDKPQLAGTDVSADFQIINVSTSPLTPLYATGPVGCPTIELSHRQIAAGGHATIHIRWHLPAKSGVITGELMLFVDHPSLTKLALPYRAVIADSKANMSPQQPTTTRTSDSTTSPIQPSEPLVHAPQPPLQSVAAKRTDPIAAPTAAGGDPVSLDLKDSLPLKDFVDIVSSQLKLNLIYDDNALSAPVSIRLGGAVTTDALLPLLKTVLQSKGFAIVPTDRPDIWRIVTSHEAQSLTEPKAMISGEGLQGTPGQIVTEFITPKSIDLETAAGLLRGFLTPNAGQLSTVPRINAIIVTDYSSQLARLHRLMDLIDKPQATASVALVPTSAAEPGPLADKISKLLAQIDKTEGRSQADKVFLSPGEDGNGIVVVGPEDQFARVRDLIKQFDTAPSLIRIDYPIQEQQRAQAMDTIRQVLGKGASDIGHDGMPRVVTASQMLSVLATDGQHRRLRELLANSLDSNSDSGMQLRAYRIENRDAAEIYATLTRLLGDNRGTSLDLDVGTRKPELRSSFNSNDINPVGVTPGETPPVAGNGTSGAQSPHTVPQQMASMTSVNITIDQGTNTLLIAANGSTHQRIEKLIKQLDQKQAQVLLEITMVSVADSDTFNAAVDAAVRGHFAGTTVSIGTNNSGIGSGNLINGQTPGIVPGLNGAIFNPASFSLFMSALESTNKARVLNSPQVLALDNKPALLQSTQEQPYTSVNASTTVSTTSFGGFAEAGTTLELTPHIAPGDYLNLEYRLEVSTFTGNSSTAGVPPPKQSDAITSVVSIPDGSTVILGGLRSSNKSHTVAKVPGLGEIPILGWIGRNQSDSNSNAAFYVFVRPTILRSSRFEDLKDMTAPKQHHMEISQDYPATELKFSQ